MNMIETKNLKKTYGDFTAVEGINLHIKKGSVYGFLGACIRKCQCRPRRCHNQYGKTG